MDNKKVWFVTGASKGLGRSLVKQLLGKGYKVAATSRSIEDLRKIATDEDFLPLAVDLKNENSIQAAVKETISRFGRIDVLVNNAGYGQVGSIEELSDAESRSNFDVNVFGLLNVTRNILPQMRAQQSGQIFNISSIAGFTGGFPGFGIYCATKFAVDGLSESLAAEVKPFGISVTIVSPGYFRTDFLTSGSLGVPANPLAAYEAVRATQHAHQEEINGNQPGDPEKAVAAIIDIADMENAPLHLFLGEDAYNLAYQKIAALEAELEQWKEVTVGTAIA
ncbi:Short-chain dehydrogenase [Chitinophaga ginsengisegetis]|uniref:Short-chain dehydrogenase n=1 Tax=Chitinophaga ginsengisegetis TaxID=393003 RepID=A0A1T5NVY6_9BACT|nr:oxidoreductase [Chitinophaga ginsengisegetis]MDR6567357.1 NAD(P)-dependent dehydrogenase (short-subunit alcohol dehydrogenase family) [Chitinophaga ginsengisegetis]MDR6647088.1 NAD(P)-dependent dehydrogenase (short-subunit alcohol dehydrogenase family) [Chitinophaga ginsengisegetis]MDR6653437.1 NAD(P)-dependent dehydrogenase (short-subunit alcohol dehydrogenase family) [Chitinophaga ginsengisegetis]SKD04640.1 Short-chain dehydrogenase [Chitinophaga ginsengisegetis]